VARSRDLLIDRKLGSVIRMQRVKLGMSQTELGEALGVSFQQIQKYERGTSAVASTRISDLCRALQITPNDLFGVSNKMDGKLAKLSSWTMKTALKLDNASPANDKRLRQCSTQGRSDGPAPHRLRQLTSQVVVAEIERLRH
jgi:transcriptional regulator with XRE-family HTH domain